MRSYLNQETTVSLFAAGTSSATILGLELPSHSRVRPISEIKRVARRSLKFDSLRPGQEEAILSIIEGRDALVVQPTGSGKSAVYQIAGLMIPGVTVVVSPLIALQKDQADAIKEQKGANAAVVNSTLRSSEIREAFEKVRTGKLEYIFLAPEQLRKPDTVAKLRASNISLYALLRYFADNFSGPCKNCDNCEEKGSGMAGSAGVR